ncbi:MAG: oxygen-independent coproporphyrinogen III oxidase [Elusimicrobia bacterium]|nr:MAG: oxygen-independent coproporphyrinogen III oxidase [Elusimicrobiota bacterium]KAF0156427.1 MAG: oxygen-independent coproporphyrinogen III oxidase [Elusimicrobiota bacterium]
MAGLYIHVPFCRSKCGYCDFYSVPGADESLVDRWLAALENEASFYRGFRADTLFIGGGTPSSLSPSQLSRLLELARSLAAGGSFAEATIEINPGSLDADKAAAMAAGGLNRASLGMQSDSPRVLETLRREPGDFRAAFRALREAGFANISLDLMTGVPSQTEDEVRSALDSALALEPEHISVYPLEVHGGTDGTGTPCGMVSPANAAGLSEDPDGAEAAWRLISAELEKAGYARYEVSNFARPGRECRHNLNYWRAGDYLGLGPAAASHFSGLRYATAHSLGEYCAALEDGRQPPRFSLEDLSPRQRAGERIMLGLRLAEGIEAADPIFIEFRQELEELLAAGSLKLRDGRARVPEKGLYVANSVLSRFV